MTEDQVSQEWERLCMLGHARKMGHIENYFAVAQRQDFYSNFGLYCEMNQSFSLDQLTSALRAICLENPILLHTVVENRSASDHGFYQSDQYLSKPWPEHDFIRVLRKVHISDVLLNTEEQNHDIVVQVLDEFKNNGGHYTSQIFELLNSVRIPYTHNTRPNWRILYFPEDSETQCRKFLFLSNHCCSDGVSAANFVQDLKERLNDPEMPFVNSGVIFNYNDDCLVLPRLPAPIETKLDYKAPKTFLARMIGCQLLRELSGYKSAGPPVKRVSEPGGSEFHSFFLNFTAQELAQVKLKMKNRVHSKCTFTPFLQACWFATVHKCGKILTHSFRERLTNILVAMNSTRLLPSNDPKLQRDYRFGCNVGGSHYNYQVSSFDVADDSNAFWRLVEYYYDVFGEAKRQNHYLCPLGALMSDQTYEKKNLDLVLAHAFLGKPRLGTMLSNLGFFSQQNGGGEYRIRDLIFAQAMGSFRFTFALNCCATDVGGLNIVLCAAKGALRSHRDWNDVCELFKSIMLKI
ncbi:LAME_0C03510g1_1 [Lachancea meyersii CBS 8951]|uniref:LAME_0C03510g1_1 n=1 Tax=Lachancea meyersii CBS 8951 TaxID=1266667 RepID=A0A1G4J0F5_9SACH|nr:LAME_0C03510g1_1 [Lachancea meyersii CBS 8951]